MIGTSTTTIHAPSPILAIAMMQNTIPVVTAPTALTAAEIRQRESVSLYLNQCTTMPACESVKDMNTPIAPEQHSQVNISQGLMVNLTSTDSFIARYPNAAATTHMKAVDTAEVAADWMMLF